METSAPSTQAHQELLRVLDDDSEGAAPARTDGAGQNGAVDPSLDATLYGNKENTAHATCKCSKLLHCVGFGAKAGFTHNQVGIP
jgi:hypothetical protein